MVFRHARKDRLETVFSEKCVRGKGTEQGNGGLTPWVNYLEVIKMKLLRGWRRIDNERGFMNETTGQKLVVTKKTFGQHFLVFLFPAMKVKDETEGRKISPEFPTEAKASTFAMDWMSNHPEGQN